MFGLGLVVGLGLFAASLIWYRGASARLSSRVLGYDAGSPSVDLKRLASGDLSRLRRAWVTPSPDPQVERERVLTTRRFRILAGMVPVSGAQPLIFDLLGRVAPAFARGGPVGVVLLMGMLAIGAYHIARATSALVAYGSGRDLEAWTLVRSILGVVGVIAVLGVVLLVRPSW